MKINKWVLTPLLLVVLLVTGCASTQPLKAPCDQYGTFCGQKTKINQW